MLCICFSCGRKTDCESHNQCDVCEADAEGIKPELVVAGSGLVIEAMTMDRQIHVILKQLHRDLAGPERECRWQHSEEKQVYWCDHVAIPARDVTDAYWHQRRGVE